jgi:hypothetical protein
MNLSWMIPFLHPKVWVPTSVYKAPRGKERILLECQETGNAVSAPPGSGFLTQ